jgi:hypothetical protein
VHCCTWKEGEGEHLPPPVKANPSKNGCVFLEGGSRT